MGSSLPHSMNRRYIPLPTYLMHVYICTCSSPSGPLSTFDGGVSPSGISAFGNSSLMMASMNRPDASNCWTYWSRRKCLMVLLGWTYSRTFPDVISCWSVIRVDFLQPLSSTSACIICSDLDKPIAISVGTSPSISICIFGGRSSRKYGRPAGRKLIAIRDDRWTTPIDPRP